MKTPFCWEFYQFLVLYPGDGLLLTCAEHPPLSGGTADSPTTVVRFIYFFHSRLRATEGGGEEGRKPTSVPLGHRPGVLI